MYRTLSEITEYRNSAKCYLIEMNNEDYFVIYGTSYCVIEHGELWDSITFFVKKRVDWNYVRKRIQNDYRYENLYDWEKYDREVKKREITVKKLFIDGEELVEI